jgi:hypothetical protein
MVRHTVHVCRLPASDTIMYYLVHYSLVAHATEYNNAFDNKHFNAERQCNKAVRMGT